MIEARVMADSKNTFGDRITSIVITFPRYILAELNTHRMLSKNSASSRAIPSKRMLQMLKDNPFIPMAWQVDHPGMQGNQYIEDQKLIDVITGEWIQACSMAISKAESLSGGIVKSEGLGTEEEIPNTKVTKQLTNRLLETFMWHKVLITGTEWENFFKLRCPQYTGCNRRGDIVRFRSRKDALSYMEKDGVDISNLRHDDILGWLQINKGQADIHMMFLAEAIWDAMNESTPVQLQPGEWHMPFGDDIDDQRIKETPITIRSDDEVSIQTRINPVFDFQNPERDFPIWLQNQRLKIATARCARTSYMNFEGSNNYELDFDLYGSLLIRPYTNRKGVTFAEDDPIHASPAEHCAKAMTERERETYIKGVGEDEDSGHYLFNDSSKGWCRNFRGFIQYREIIEK